MPSMVCKKECTNEKLREHKNSPVLLLVDPLKEKERKDEGMYIFQNVVIVGLENVSTIRIESTSIAWHD